MKTFQPHLVSPLEVGASSSSWDVDLSILTRTKCCNKSWISSCFLKTVADFIPALNKGCCQSDTRDAETWRIDHFWLDLERLSPSFSAATPHYLHRNLMLYETMRKLFSSIKEILMLGLDPGVVLQQRTVSSPALFTLYTSDIHHNTATSICRSFQTIQSLWPGLQGEEGDTGDWWRFCGSVQEEPAAAEWPGNKINVSGL